MNKRNVLFFIGFTALLTGSCTCKKPGGVEPTSVGSPDIQTVSPVGGTVQATPLPATVRTPEAATTFTVSVACPKGMREVTGEYCANVEHRCLAGRDTVFRPDPDHPGGLYIQETVSWSCSKPEGCAVPNYCDKFAKGYAVCTSKSTKPLHFCIDDYEYPGVIGEKPRVMVSWNEAKSLCEARGQRLCGDDEWTQACEGPEHLPYPYGWERDSTACNIDKPQRKGGVNAQALGSKNAAVRDAELERLDQREPIGASPHCTSPYGVHDMTGNVDEWTVNVTRGGKPFKSLFKGGHWVGGARNRCRPATDTHNEDFAFYAEGFRCCADPKAAK